MLALAGRSHQNAGPKVLGLVEKPVRSVGRILLLPVIMVSKTVRVAMKHLLLTEALIALIEEVVVIVAAELVLLVATVAAEIQVGAEEAAKHPFLPNYLLPVYRILYAAHNFSEFPGSGLLHFQELRGGVR